MDSFLANLGNFGAKNDQLGGEIEFQKWTLGVRFVNFWFLTSGSFVQSSFGDRP